MHWTIAAEALRRTPLLPQLTRIWILAIVVGSLQPARPEPFVALHRQIHWLAFAAAAFLLLFPARSLRHAIQRAAAILLLGLALEWVQHFLYHGAIEWLDVRDDVVAILVGSTVFWRASRTRPAKTARL